MSTAAVESLVAPVMGSDSASDLHSVIERCAVFFMAVAAVALRVLAIVNHRFDSDEAQHLHVAWGWNAGLLQYRDVFDNHAPLFHLLMAPAVRMTGERADVLLFMRLLMIPLAAAVVWSTWQMGARAFSPRVGLWAALLLSVIPPFLLKSIEFRTDNLWMALWMLALLALWRPAPAPRWFFLSGLAFGGAVATSLKTSLILISIGLAGLGIRVLFPDPSAGWIRARNAGALFGGLLIVPFSIAFFLVSKGIWSDFYYCAIRFNEVLPSTVQYQGVLKIVYPLSLCAVFIVGRAVARSSQSPTKTFLVLLIGIYTVTLGSFWTFISTRDFLPVMPFCAILMASWVDGLWREPGAIMPRRRRLAVLSTAVVACIGLTIWSGTLLRNQTRGQIGFLRAVLRLTHPGDSLMDLKGESVFRRRPFHYILEVISRAQLREGLLPDTIEQSIVEAPCYVAINDDLLLPPAGRKFLNDNFISVGRLRVAGHAIGPAGDFNVAVPGPYALITPAEPNRELDGRRYVGPLWLARGPHHLSGDGSLQTATFLWAPAVARGFHPISPQQRAVRHLRHREARRRADHWPQ